MVRTAAIKQQRAAASTEVPPASTGVGVAKKAIGPPKTSLAPVQAAEETPPPSPTNSTKRGTPRERGTTEDSTAKKARLSSKEPAGDTENAQKAAADTETSQIAAADTDNVKQTAAENVEVTPAENVEESAAETVPAVRYQLRARNQQQVSANKQVMEKDEDENNKQVGEENEDGDEDGTTTKSKMRIKK